MNTKENKKILCLDCMFAGEYINFGVYVNKENCKYCRIHGIERLFFYRVDRCSSYKSIN